MVSYVFLILIVLMGGYFYFDNKRRHQWIKKHGIIVRGTIIKNEERHPFRQERLGGNINNPTIKFMTKEGATVTGQPISGFTSQREIPVPSSISVIYDVRNPKRFCVRFN